MSTICAELFILRKYTFPFNRVQQLLYAVIFQAKTTTLFIEAADTSLINSGGAPNTPYWFTLTAGNIPAGIREVRFEWTPGFGAGGSFIARVSFGGQAIATIELSYPWQVCMRLRRLYMMVKKN